MSWLDDLGNWLTQGDNGEAKNLAKGIYGGLGQLANKYSDPNYIKKWGYYKGPTYAGAGDTTKAGWDMATGYANGAANGGYGDAVRGATGYFGDMIGQGGLSAGQRGDLSQVNGLWDAYGGMGRNNGLTDGQRGQVGSLTGVGRGYEALGDNGGLTGGQAADLRGYTGLAGDYGDLGQAYDPNSAAYKRLRSNAGNDALTSINSVFNSSGRFGGGSNAKSAGEGVANAYAGLDYANMQNDINNQYRSLDSQAGIFSGAFGMGQQGVGNQFGALAGRLGTEGQAFGQMQQGVGNRFGALNGQLNSATTSFGMGQQGFANQLAGAAALPGLYSAGLMPSQTYGAIGAAQDANTQGGYDAAQADWNRRHYAMLDNLGRVASVGNTTSGVIPAGGNNTPGWLQGIGAIGSTVPWWSMA